MPPAPQTTECAADLGNAVDFVADFVAALQHAAAERGPVTLVVCGGDAARCTALGTTVLAEAQALAAHAVCCS